MHNRTSQAKHFISPCNFDLKSQNSLLINWTYLHERMKASFCLRKCVEEKAKTYLCFLSLKPTPFLFFYKAMISKERKPREQKTMFSKGLERGSVYYGLLVYSRLLPGFVWISEIRFWGFFVFLKAKCLKSIWLWSRDFF